MTIRIENPNEVWGPNGPKDKWGHCVGAKLIHFEVVIGDDRAILETPFENTFRAKGGEILLDFSNGKEMRIYIEKESGDLIVYTD